MIDVREHEAVLRAQRLALGLLDGDRSAELREQLEEPRRVLAQVLGVVDGDEQAAVAAREQEVAEQRDPPGRVQLELRAVGIEYPQLAPQATDEHIERGEVLAARADQLPLGLRQYLREVIHTGLRRPPGLSTRPDTKCRAGRPPSA